MYPANARGGSWEKKHKGNVKWLLAPSYGVSSIIQILQRVLRIKGTILSSLPASPRANSIQVIMPD